MLDRPTLEAEIRQLLDDMFTRHQYSTQEFAQRLSTSIDKFVKGAQVVYQNGLTATADGDPVVGQINHTIQ